MTARAKDRGSVFGAVAGGELRLNDAGRMARDVWEELPKHYPQVMLGAFVVMPNHAHGIIIIGAGFKPAPTKQRCSQYPLPLTDGVRGSMDRRSAP
jgi:REP element-mobilizing transposase RayT